MAWILLNCRDSLGNNNFHCAHPLDSNAPSGMWRKPCILYFTNSLNNGDSRCVNYICIFANAVSERVQ